MKPMLIKGGRIIDPAQGVDRIADLLVEDGVVRGIDRQIAPPDDAEVIDAAGLVVCPGFIDLHCHLREPGYEDKETIATGTRAAASMTLASSGGAICVSMPRTTPFSISRSAILSMPCAGSMMRPPLISIMRATLPFPIQSG